MPSKRDPLLLTMTVLIVSLLFLLLRAYWRPRPRNSSTCPSSGRSQTSPESPTKHKTDDLSAFTTLAKLTVVYRHAELIHAEVELTPCPGSFSKPLMFLFVWTPASLSPATGWETSYYGGRQITVGGPVMLSSTTVIPADLSRMNPVIKSSVSYNDCPRWSLTCPLVSGSSANTKLATLYIRGTVRLSSPSGNCIP
ncbi:coat protein [Bermuda grass etched-line virus]|uniref:Coat protein n=1 Tax=Bermuda grass etched-line virus TaxID=167478 RepID=Q8V0G9_9VIRU|nr:coat protein [Bermuda grass etched-line virus]AAK85135.1 coat protein [Bermuda grass etched-line virus]